jgi:hypothetical protein
MKPGEVWSFPLADDADARCLLRVMLAVADLRLPDSHPMAFVRNCLLVQLGRPGQLDPERFASEILFDGVFLAFKPQIAKRQGFQKVTVVPAPVEAVAFPCWLIDASRAGILLCQGEITQRVVRPDAAALYRKWDIRLSPTYPAQLAGRVRRGVASSDLRYHALRQECLSELGVDLATDYMKAVDQRDPARRRVYERAMEAGRPTTR